MAKRTQRFGLIVCGIVGEYRKQSRVDPEVLSSMTQALQHRGPDGSGTWSEARVGLGHTRLAIIDTHSRANQPMMSPCGRFVLTYNGEIYNFRELRSLLTTHGHRFGTTSDTEVLLAAWSQWGAGCVTRLNGMFAFAVFDREESRLTLVRDRYGIKPLYYFESAHGIVFASEQKALRLHPDCPRQLDKSGLLEYLTFQNFFTDRTLVKNVKMVPSGSTGTYSDFTSCLEFDRYWDFDFSTTKNEITDLREYQEELERLFVQAVKRQMVSDVEVGSFLSGGLDSGLITAVASREVDGFKTFTCGFDLSSASGMELTFDERHRAEAMSASFGTEHYQMVLKAGDMERSLSRVVETIEEPRVGQSYPNYFAAKLASRFVKVVLAGTGGDEMFGGYPWRYFFDRSVTDSQTFNHEYFLSWQRLMSEKEFGEVCRPLLRDEQTFDPRQIFADVLSGQSWNGNSYEDQVAQSLYLEAKTFLHGLLVIEDKLSMVHGLETRIPMLDNDLVDFALSTPMKMKVDLAQGRIFRDENLPGKKAESFPQSRTDGKIALRDLAEKLLPAEIATAAKQGFSAPDATWFRGRSIEFVKSRILNDQSPIYDSLDYRSVVDLIQMHLSGKQNRRLLIWSLLYLDEYLKKF